MKSLTKENFWNELREHYPSEMEAFCKWIDEYKKNVGWEQLFNAGPLEMAEAPKYHDLPISMQVGIFAQFAWEHGGGDSHTFILDDMIASMDDFVEAIRNWFAEVQKFKDRESNSGETFE